MIKLGQGWAAGDYMNLLTENDIIEITRAAGAKNIIVKRNLFFGFTMDFSITASKFQLNNKKNDSL